MANKRNNQKSCPPKMAAKIPIMINPNTTTTPIMTKTHKIVIKPSIVATKMSLINFFIF